MSGQQTNDPAKFAKALVTVVEEEQPPLRWVAGADAVEAVEQKANELLAQVEAYRELSSALAHDSLNGRIGRLPLVEWGRRRGPRRRTPSPSRYHRRCYVRGPEAIIVERAEQIG
jgi:hypothetical protein